MSRSWAGGSTRRWRVLRAYVLDRDRHMCQVPKRGRPCGARATHVDHIVPLADGGAKWDPANCRAACWSCNLSRGTQTTKAGPTVPVTVLVGPPAGGKTTRARELARPGTDIVIDLDALAAALTIPESGIVHDYPQHVRTVAIGARQAALRRAVALPASSGARVVVIHAVPTGEQVAAYVADGWTVEVIDPGPAVVRARCSASSRGTRHLSAIDQWYVRRADIVAALEQTGEWDW